MGPRKSGVLETRVGHLNARLVMPKSPESEILVKIFADIGETCGKHLAKKIADFDPSISRKIGSEKFHQKSSTNSTGHEIKFFHNETLGAWGHNELNLEGHSLALSACHLHPVNANFHGITAANPPFRKPPFYRDSPKGVRAKGA